jgi:hypothetical protein
MRQTLRIRWVRFSMMATSGYLLGCSGGDPSEGSGETGTATSGGSGGMGGSGGSGGEGGSSSGTGVDVTGTPSGAVERGTASRLPRRLIHTTSTARRATQLAVA